MDEAVDSAFAHACAGDTVLLSPACASLDMYPNFIARGEHFRELILNVTNARQVEVSP